MDPLKSVLAGQPLQIGAATWNDLLAAARSWRQQRSGPGSTPPAALPLTPSLECLVKYDESPSLTLPVHSVVTLASLIPELSGDNRDPHGVNRRPAYVAGTPAGPGDAVVVTLEPIQGQSLGRAVHTGHVVALVDVLDADHTRAVPIDGDTEKFASAEGGGYPIVAKEGGTGEVMAVVNLGASHAFEEDIRSGYFGRYDGTFPADDSVLSGVLASVEPGTYLVLANATVMFTSTPSDPTSGGVVRMTASLSRFPAGSTSGAASVCNPGDVVWGPVGSNAGVIMETVTMAGVAVVTADADFRVRLTVDSDDTTAEGLFTLFVNPFYCYRLAGAPTATGGGLTGTFGG